MQITLPDYATRFDALSLSVCLLDLKGVGNTPRQATGFFWRHADKVFLITNWHNVTGINIDDGRSIANGWCPEKIGIQYFTKPTAVTTQATSIPNAKSIDAPTIEIPLYENFDQPFWLQHPKTFDAGIDVVALRVDHLVNTKEVQCVNDFSYSRLFQFVGSDVFIVGHPIAKSQSTYPLPFPVWKRGSIASELLVPWNMRPAFLVDARTSRGMSGSPVFARAYGPAALGDGTIKVDNILTSEFMGIYSGRIFDDNNEASIGMVWHRNLIDQILNAPSSGSRNWSAASPTSVFTAGRKNEQ
jgi:hypothetical protein